MSILDRPLGQLGRLREEAVLVAMDGSLHFAVAVAAREREMAAFPDALALALSERTTVLGLRTPAPDVLEIGMLRDRQPIEVDDDALLSMVNDVPRDLLIGSRSSPRRFCQLLGVTVRGVAAAGSCDRAENILYYFER
jgi:hypothetical protein